MRSNQGSRTSPGVFRRGLLAAAAVAAAGLAIFVPAAPSQASAAAPAAVSEDRYTWLEDVSGARSMEWVKKENARTDAVLEKDPRYASFVTEARTILQDPHRLPVPSLRGDQVYNLWRDAEHPRGLYRRTSLTEYLAPEPRWQTVLDLDALGKAEHKGWVLHGMSCLYPGTQYCIANLSDGGEDANTGREFDLRQNAFVSGGFTLPRSKGSVTWEDKDTLLLSRDWGSGSMTQSGYPFVIKEWKRGTPLESAREVFRGETGDQVGSYGAVLQDAQGDRLTLFWRGVTFFENQTFVKTPDGAKRLAIPGKASVEGLLSGRVLVHLRESWTPDGTTRSFPQGSLVQLQLADVLRDPAHLKPEVVFAPTATEFLQAVDTSRDKLLLTTLNNVQGRAYVYTPAGRGWSHRQLSLPENVSVSIDTANDSDNHYVVGVTGFLTPPSLWLGDAGAGEAKEIKRQPAQFDASRDEVEQLFATSKDGTRVPYFVVHPRGMKMDGSNPTLLTAYGGFEVAETPGYSAFVGKLWLEHGGVYVLANIRGGGEFGPAWHEAGLKTHRQRIYDDFAAVGEDLIARRITSTPHLGIQGGSNGGLLMGVEMTQHPDLWGAVVIQVPLLDMLRFEQIAAGASWVGEYGTVKNAEERAFLAGISPYHQLKPGVKYPEPFLFTTTKDDRVGPQHARKFAARMEELHDPFFYQEIVEGGHGAGADIQQEARSRALTFVYLARKLMP